jgi:hypothetical protein
MAPGHKRVGRQGPRQEGVGKAGVECRAGVSTVKSVDFTGLGYGETVKVVQGAKIILRALSRRNIREEAQGSRMGQLQYSTKVYGPVGQDKWLERLPRVKIHF